MPTFVTVKPTTKGGREEREREREKIIEREREKIIERERESFIKREINDLHFIQC